MSVEATQKNSMTPQFVPELVDAKPYFQGLRASELFQKKVAVVNTPSCFLALHFLSMQLNNKVSSTAYI